VIFDNPTPRKRGNPKKKLAALARRLAAKKRRQRAAIKHAGKPRREA
jgi:hypothetical protein